MQDKINKIARDTNNFLKRFIKKQKKNRINKTYEVRFITRRKKD